MTYKIINYQEKHLESCAKLVKATWNLHSNYQNLNDELIIYKIYVKQCLDYSKHRKIIIDDRGNVHGILFGSIEDEGEINNFIWQLRAINTRLWINMNLLLGRLGNRKIAKNNLSEQLNIDKLGEEKAVMFDGEVNLFIVSKTLRGQKFGYKLMNDYIEFCRENKLESVFLWTELGCSFTFYERYGFEKVDSFYHNSLTQGSETTNNGFVYAYEINRNYNKDKKEK